MSKATLPLLVLTLAFAFACDDQRYVSDGQVQSGSPSDMDEDGANGEDNNDAVVPSNNNNTDANAANPNNSIDDPPDPIDDPPDPVNNNDVDPIDDPPDPIDPVGDVCLPQATKIASPIARDALRWLLEGECGVSRAEIDQDGDGSVDRVVEPALAGRVCADEACVGWTEELPAVSRSWEERSIYDPVSRDPWRGLITGRRVMSDGELTIHLVVDGQQDNSSARQRFERVYTESGLLLSERHSFGGSLWFEVNNVWGTGAHEGLRWSTTIHDHVNGTGVSELNWEYDADRRLVRSTLLQGDDLPHQFVLDDYWTYDDNGRPASVHRQFVGQPYLDQAWVFDDDGVLLERSTTVHPRPESAGVYANHHLDDFVPLPNVRGFDYAFDDALPRPRPHGDCLLPPTSVSHGYPFGEDIWELGWKLEERPGGIGFDYGYSGFGYNYGSLAWFGHGGPAASYVGDYGAGAVVIDQRYEGGVMTFEQARAADAEGRQTTLERRRTFDEDRITLDTLEIQHPDGAWTSLISLSYDADGRLTGRDWTYDGTVAARHTWAYDEKGRLVEHTIAFDSLAQWSAGFVGPQPPAGGGALDAEVVWTQRWTEGEGSLEMERTKRAGEQEEGDAGHIIVRGVEDGELTIREGGLLQGFEVRADDGRLLRHGSGEVEAPYLLYTRTFDDDGLFVAWEVEGTSELRGSETYDHVCE